MTDAPPRTLAAEWATYLERTPTSAARAAEAGRWLPGGDSRSTLTYPPHPLYLDRGEGATLVDVDGHRYLDLSNNHTVLVHGNGFGPVRDAVAAQLDRGTCFPGPVDLQVEAARALVERIPSVERVRFTNSGTEATLHAVRAARAFTGRPLIAKAEGAYHGSQDDVFVSTHPGPDQAGPAHRPAPVPRTPGLGRAALTDTVVVPFNDPAGAAELLAEVGDRLAAVLLEPVMGSAGMIPATREYAHALQEACRASGALLVVDEVITLRLAVDGGQGRLGLAPDLSCFGKIIGGGLPLGAFGGRADVMAQFDPTAPAGPLLAHPGSINANPVSLTAALVTLDHLTPAAIATLDDRGERLRRRLGEVAAAHPQPLTVTGAGSLLGLHPTPGPVTDFRATWPIDPELRHALFLGLLNEGVLTDPRGAACLSTATTDDDLETVAAALDRVLGRMGSGR